MAMIRNERMLTNARAHFGEQAAAQAKKSENMYGLEMVHPVYGITADIESPPTNVRQRSSTVTVIAKQQYAFRTNGVR